VTSAALAIAERLAVVERLEHGELVGVLEDQVTDPVDDPAALRRRHPAPVRALVVEAPARGGDREVDVDGLAVGHRAEALLRRGVEGLERPARDRLHPIAVDEELARLADEVLNPCIELCNSHM